MGRRWRRSTSSTPRTGKKTLAELFEGRSQLLAYNIMYGPDYELGACPGCTSLGDEFDGPRVHLSSSAT